MFRRRDLMSTAKSSGGGFVFPDVDGCWVEKWVFRTQGGLVSARNGGSDAYQVVAYLNLSNPKCFLRAEVNSVLFAIVVIYYRNQRQIYNELLIYAKKI